MKQNRVYIAPSRAQFISDRQASYRGQFAAAKGCALPGRGRRGLEGIVAKRLGDAYRPNRTRYHKVLNRSVCSSGQCNTACSLSAGVSKPKVFRGR
jgi:hypothetical protein